MVSYLYNSNHISKALITFLDGFSNNQHLLIVSLHRDDRYDGRGGGRYEGGYHDRYERPHDMYNSGGGYPHRGGRGGNKTLFIQILANISNYNTRYYEFKLALF